MKNRAQRLQRGEEWVAKQGRADAGRKQGGWHSVSRVTAGRGRGGCWKGAGWVARRGHGRS